MQSIARKRGHDKKVLILRLSGGGYFVCDEYYPTDNGRIHILGDHCYATFDSTTFTVEIKKASIDVASIRFCEDTWPAAITDRGSRAAILAHFGIPND